MKNLEKNLKNVVYSEFPGHSQTSHYPGMLALCDLILVTEDSINMISEAAASGRPVIILGVERKRPGKKLVFDFTLEKFTEKGYAEYLPADELYRLKDMIKRTEGVSFRKLDEAELCARKILKTLK
jgi:mitochondrial fission protein ELM1